MPHCGGFAEDAHEGSVDLALANMAAHLAGEPLLTPVA